VNYGKILHYIHRIDIFFLKRININFHNAAVTVKLVYCNNRRTALVNANWYVKTVPGASENVNKSDFKNCKHGHLEHMAAIMKYSTILTFFLVSDVVSSEVKSRLGAVIR
jgi:hypothetical protein